MTDYQYPGAELELFAQAHHWKRYWGAQIAPHLRGSVLEVGAGIGSNTLALADHGAWTEWTALEPDPGLARTLELKLGAARWKHPPRSIAGTLGNLPSEPAFDAILYLDVLEHIEDDRSELQEAWKRLRPGGKVIVLAPAHAALFSPFDTAVGHFRRYDRKSLRRVAPTGAKEISIRYLDSLGMILSLTNRHLLKNDRPKKDQILIWDRIVVRLSRVTDILSGHRLGKSVLAVWQKP